MSKKDIYKLLSIRASLSNKEYYNIQETIYDEKVNNCLLMLYCSMVSSTKEQSDKLIESFKEKYDKLNEKQKEIIKNEYVKKIANIYKPKVMEKKKER